MLLRALLLGIVANYLQDIVSVNANRLSVFGGQPVLGGFELPILTSRSTRHSKRGDVNGSSGLGNNADLLYTVPIVLGGKVFPLHLDTGSSDLWVISDHCTSNSCNGSTAPRYPRSSLHPAEANVQLLYGDSTSRTFATGTVGYETASVANIAINQQPFGLVNDTSNAVVKFDTSGIFGLGFPFGSKILRTMVQKQFGKLQPTDDFIMASETYGPLLLRMLATGALEQPLFTISLQRNTIDISGEGRLTIGTFPEGLTEANFTWMPLRLYTPEEGGLQSPSFAPKEVYPYRWEIDIDGVFLDGRRLASSNISANGVNSKRTSVILDTGNSVLLGPRDVVTQVLQSVTTSYDATSSQSSPVLPCNVPHTLSFQIGGKLFPIDPRDFIGQLEPGDSRLCRADNILPTDPPSVGALYRWSLGTPFFRSNLVAFHYGNLTHPSSDLPRIGIMSLVPPNADQLLASAVSVASKNGGDFPNIARPPPTALSVVSPTVTVSKATTTSTSTFLSTQTPEVVAASSITSNAAMTRLSFPLFSTAMLITLVLAINHP